MRFLSYGFPDFNILNVDRIDRIEAFGQGKIKVFMSSGSFNVTTDYWDFIRRVDLAKIQITDDQNVVNGEPMDFYTKKNTKDADGPPP